MRENFRGNKRRKEEMRKKRQEEKRNKRLNKKEQPLSPDPSNFDTPDAAVSPVAEQGQ